MAAGTGQETAELPLFYQRPAPISKERHGGKHMKAASSYAFAAATNAVPLVMQEMALAAKSYPIVFTPGSPTTPVAVLGVRRQENLFLEDDGRWQAGHYVPAYVRRYPFVFTNSPNSDQLVLCIDEASERLSDTEGTPMYQANEPSEDLQTSLKFCEEYQRQLIVTKNFMADLELQDLLVDKEMTFNTATGTSYRLSGFRMIEESRFNELPDGIILDWRERGWLGFIYCHLISTSNLMQIGERAAQRDAGKTD